ncbi:MAG: trypsin-like peptidase domain-containing protein [Acidimicrobiales bacterium]|nr:trypsin-like peptidase domain-containing protein [Acidimicrobiales bacterium]
MKDWLSAAAVLIVLTVVTLVAPESDKGEDHNQDLNLLTLPETSVPLSEEFDTGLINTARTSTVSIRGSNCPRFQFGSGFSLTNGLIVTNAHVVAGIDSPLVKLVSPEGTVIETQARVIGFDAVIDLAALDIGEHEMRGFDIAQAVNGENVALIGYNRDGEPDWRPGQISQHIRATGLDIYGDSGPGRDALVLSMDVDPGHSGSPLVNSLGQVVGVVFSSVKGGSSTAYAVQVNELNSFIENLPDEATTVVSQCR